MMQRTVLILSSAFLFGFTSTTTKQSADTAQNLSTELSQSLPGLIVSGDYRTASRLYLDLANARSRDHESGSACAALSQSLENYRKALASEAGVPFREVAADIRDEDEGMQEIRSRFGCTRADFS